MGLASIGASLRQLGHQVSIVDMARRPELRYVPADITGISVKSHAVREAQALTKWLRGRSSGKIVWGGAHVTLLKENLIAENPEVDHFVVGEGEFFTEHLGAAKVCCMPYVEDLDSLPFPDYTLFDSYTQIVQSPYPLICSRGCPYGCFFCSVPLISGRKIRYRSVEKCISEIEAAKTQGFNRVQVLDDNFTFDMDFAKEFCREVKKVQIPWYLPNGIRADKLDEELASLLVGAGCYLVSFGVESADSGVYKSIGKGETLEDIGRAVEIAKKVGLYVNCYFIIGLPGSTFEKDLESFKWAREHAVKADFNMLVPYPGTRIWEWARNKRISKDYGSHFGKLAYPTFETEEYTAEDMMDAFLILNFFSGSGFTHEWYEIRQEPELPDLKLRAGRHWELLKACKLVQGENK